MRRRRPAVSNINWKLKVSEELRVRSEEWGIFEGGKAAVGAGALEEPEDGKEWDEGEQEEKSWVNEVHG